ncbi:hypothetical protein V3N99_08080 [Dermatophilaceae bacterium Soc4.6]
MRQVGDVDGCGRYGILEATPDGLLLCSDCGGAFAHLGLHVARAHGSTAAAYRLEHGLSRSRGLVSTEIRVKQAANAAGSTATQQALAGSRDAARAAAARIAGGLPVSPAAAAQRNARIAAAGRATRTGRVTTCTGCGVEFCALVGSARRRFCSRSCASRTTRATTRQAPQQP